MVNKINTLIAVDAQLYRFPDGKVYTPSIYGYSFWKRYLEVFESIIVVGRIEETTNSRIKEEYIRSDGPNVSFFALPFARGMKEYFFKWFDFAKLAKKSCENIQCAVIRLPSIPAFFVEHYIFKKNIPYCLEIVVDPYTAYPKGMIRTVLTAHLKKTIKRANGVSYVTKYALQKEYPCQSILNRQSTKYFDSYYSTIMLDSSYFTKPRNYDNHDKVYNIIHVANNMNNNVKGHEILIRAASLLIERGDQITLTFVGDGKKRRDFEELANELKISNYVEFTGLLSSAEAVREKLIESDLFVFPTKSEGLPRVVIEAMAVGLPCISTPVNGIPELLDDDFLLDPLDYKGFANKIHVMIHSSEMMNRCSEINIEKAKEYENSKLQKRRNEFYSKLKELT